MAQKTATAIASSCARRTVDSERILAAFQQLDWFGCALVLALSTANDAIRLQCWQSEAD